MNKSRYAVLGALLTLIVMAAHWATADTVYLKSPAQNAETTRPCAFDGVHAQTVAVTSTSARTSNAVGVGAARVFCTQSAHLYQGVLGVTGPTAGTGDTFLPLLTPEYVFSTGGRFAFVRDSADGTCYVTDCH